MRMILLIFAAAAAIALSGCAVASTAASVTGAVISTTAEVTGDVIGAAARTVSGSGKSDRDKD